jgi:proliferating cell nuclear antigen
MSEAKYFRIKLNEPKTFIKLFEILGKLLDFAEISVSPNSLNLVAMDVSHVLNVDLTLPKDFFNEYTITIPKRIRVDLSELNQVLKRSRNESMFLMDSSFENKLVAQFQGNENKRNFRIKLQDPIDNIEPIKILDYNANMSFAADQLAELIGDAFLANEYATFALGAKDEAIFTIDANGDTEFNAEVKTFLEKPTFIGKQEAEYSLVYLSDIAKLKDVATKVNLRFSSEKPLELVYPLDHDGKIVLTLAPRVEEEEDEEAIPDEPKKKIDEPLVAEDETEDEDDTEYSEADVDEPEENNEKIHEHIAAVYKRNGKKKKPEATEATEL